MITREKWFPNMAMLPIQQKISCMCHRNTTKYLQIALLSLGLHVNNTLLGGNCLQAVHYVAQQVCHYDKLTMVIVYYYYTRSHAQRLAILFTYNMVLVYARSRDEDFSNHALQ